MKKNDNILTEEYDDIDEHAQVSEENIEDQPQFVSVTCCFWSKFDFLIVVNSILETPYQSEWRLS